MQVRQSAQIMLHCSINQTGSWQFSLTHHISIDKKAYHGVLDLCARRMMTMQQAVLPDDRAASICTAAPQAIDFDQIAMTTRHANRRKIEMSVIDTTRSTQFQTAPVGLGLARFVAAFTAWKDARATRKALSVLSDRELDDIGLTRADIANFSLR
ncbi:DUF1127 domain-containing protein [Roseovarius sp. S4756]|uniref:DUF1127 domain-containing protein n=1 Tax=Roseovarius maritimus TaxID=3342637 RepID=UPI00372A8F7F